MKKILTAFGVSTLLTLALFFSGCKPGTDPNGNNINSNPTVVTATVTAVDPPIGFYNGNITGSYSVAVSGTTDLSRFVVYVNGVLKSGLSGSYTINNVVVDMPIHVIVKDVSDASKVYDDKIVNITVCKQVRTNLVNTGPTKAYKLTRGQKLIGGVWVDLTFPCDWVRFNLNWLTTNMHSVCTPGQPDGASDFLLNSGETMMAFRQGVGSPMYTIESSTSAELVLISPSGQDRLTYTVMSY